MLTVNGQGHLSLTCTSYTSRIHWVNVLYALGGWIQAKFSAKRRDGVISTNSLSLMQPWFGPHAIDEGPMSNVLGGSVGSC